MNFKAMVADRVLKIQSIDSKYNLRENAYISFSGGKDSTVLHYLVDIALPNNEIPRVFINTGVEYGAILSFVQGLASKDKRFVILEPKRNIKEVLEQYGYPFKSKQHSHNLSIFQNNGGFTETTLKYCGFKEGNNKIKCPSVLMYQFDTSFTLKCSDRCCYKMKKEPAKEWAEANNKSVVMTGMRKQEWGRGRVPTVLLQRKMVRCKSSIHFL